MMLTEKVAKARKRVRRHCSSKAFHKARNRKQRVRWLKRMERQANEFQRDDSTIT